MPKILNCCDSCILEMNLMIKVTTKVCCQITMNIGQWTKNNKTTKEIRMHICFQIHS